MDDIDNSEQFICIMFAGPNGSGKSTVKAINDDLNYGQYINPDDIAKALVNDQGMDQDTANRQAAVISSQRIQDCIQNQESFTFETVMSHHSKIEVLESAQSAGLQTVLLFVSTSDASINVDRVDARVQSGGHDVPTDKIISRYDRAMQLLSYAIEKTDTAILYDNSTTDSFLALQIHNDEIVYIDHSSPEWIDEYVITQLNDILGNQMTLQSLKEQMTRDATVKIGSYINAHLQHYDEAMGTELAKRSKHKGCNHEPE